MRFTLLNVAGVATGELVTTGMNRTTNLVWANRKYKYDEYDLQVLCLLTFHCQFSSSSLCNYLRSCASPYNQPG